MQIDFFSRIYSATTQAFYNDTNYTTVTEMLLF